MKSKNELAEEYCAKFYNYDFATTVFLAGYDSRDAEIAVLKEELQKQDIFLKGMACESFDDNFKLIELEQEKQNLLAAAESDLLRMAELRDENKYLRERVALLLKEHMEQL